ncbi:hypothetical protein LPH50_10165 [Xylella taiwanensis]|nr:hypothetical protein [Xylella taiwanensis]MCD8458703.1 hypothetical protein [Xylella taiwanensis]MCD8463104.1 hypothetical protein [Xylella taiwanensis]MCD8465345.1 hypothetical protein [Xylella taiwanensis]MCD8467099.1 hypothetical protein [Xylella taiwanensis]UFN02037.1 hypothetical protein LPH43_10245 [Xylella taiwanensis]
MHALEVIGQRDRHPVYRTTDWEPIEISIVSIPADPSVGIGCAFGKLATGRRRPYGTDCTNTCDTPKAGSPHD